MGVMVAWSLAMDAASLGAADGGEKRTGRDSPPWKGHNIGLEVTYYRNSFQAMGAMVTWSASVAADPLVPLMSGRSVPAERYLLEGLRYRIRSSSLRAPVTGSVG